MSGRPSMGIRAGRLRTAARFRDRRAAFAAPDRLRFPRRPAHAGDDMTALEPRARSSAPDAPARTPGPDGASAAAPSTGRRGSGGGTGRRPSGSVPGPTRSRATTPAGRHRAVRPVPRLPRAGRRRRSTSPRSTLDSARRARPAGGGRRAGRPAGQLRRADRRAEPGPAAVRAGLLLRRPAAARHPRRATRPRPCGSASWSGPARSRPATSSASSRSCGSRSSSSSSSCRASCPTCPATTSPPSTARPARSAATSTTSPGCPTAGSCSSAATSPTRASRPRWSWRARTRCCARPPTRMTSPGEVLASVNDMLCADIPAHMFVTCLAIALDPASGEMDVRQRRPQLALHPHRRRRRRARADGDRHAARPHAGHGLRRDARRPGRAARGCSCTATGWPRRTTPPASMFGFDRLAALVGTTPGGEVLIDRLPVRAHRLHRRRRSSRRTTSRSSRSSGRPRRTRAVRRERVVRPSPRSPRRAPPGASATSSPGCSRPSNRCT